MDQQAKDTKADALDLSVQTCNGSPGSFSSNSCSDHQKIIGDDKHHLKTQIQKKQNLLVDNYMSEEELRIRCELENDIERDLEEEIKDGIYHLALRLHRLYQHQKERINNERQGQLESSDHHHHHQKKKKNNNTLSEVNINIRMEGGTKIEIKEMKKEEDPDKGRPRSSSRSYNMQAMQVYNKKKFDWANSLRSGANPGAINKRSNPELGWKC